MKKFLFALAIILFSGLGFFAFKAQAAQLDLTIDSSDGSNGSALLDGPAYGRSASRRTT